MFIIVLVPCDVGNLSSFFQLSWLSWLSMLSMLCTLKRFTQLTQLRMLSTALSLWAEGQLSVSFTAWSHTLSNFRAEATKKISHQTEQLSDLTLCSGAQSKVTHLNKTSRIGCQIQFCAASIGKNHSCVLRLQPSFQ